MNKHPIEGCPGYSPSKSFTELKIPEEISLEPCRGTGNFSPLGRIQISCLAPCLSKVHPAFLRRFTNSFFFISMISFVI